MVPSGLYAKLCRAFLVHCKTPLQIMKVVLINVHYLPPKLIITIETSVK